MAATPSILVKYDVRDGAATKEASNRFHFSGGTPADATAWAALAAAIRTDFKACLNTDQGIREWVGYSAASDVAVWSEPDSTAGTFDIAANSAHQSPDFCVALLRWSTDQRTAKNHPIYLFSYIHCAASAAATGDGSQQLHGNLITRLDTFGAGWVTGYSDGTNTYHRAGPNGAVAQGYTLDHYIKDHDLSPR